MKLYVCYGPWTAAPRPAGHPCGAAHDALRQAGHWCAKQRIGAGAVKVVGLSEVVARVRHEAASKQYRDNPVLVSLKVLQEAGLLDHPTVADSG